MTFCDNIIGNVLSMFQHRLAQSTTRRRQWNWCDTIYLVHSFVNRQNIDLDIEIVAVNYRMNFHLIQLICTVDGHWTQIQSECSTCSTFYWSLRRTVVAALCLSVSILLAINGILLLVQSHSTAHYWFEIEKWTFFSVPFINYYWTI